ncbi:transposase [Streptomyces flavidovirens]|uniref:Transposase n=1 Tax=Streptomyces flavidovirens TaxID=67298 RepID=A0ABW6RAG4_9ACTN
MPKICRHATIDACSTSAPSAPTVRRDHEGRLPRASALPLPASGVHRRIDRIGTGSAGWAPSYFAGSYGGAPLGIVKDYIENQ